MLIHISNEVVKLNKENLKLANDSSEDDISVISKMFSELSPENRIIAKNYLLSLVARENPSSTPYPEKTEH